MKEITKKWLLHANADLDVAKRSFTGRNINNWTLLLILWHLHQAVEKTLKAIMLNKEKKLIMIHDLPELLKKSELQNISEKQKILIYRLNKYYLRSRYPDLIYSPLPKVDKELTKELISETELLLKFLKNQL